MPEVKYTDRKNTNCSKWDGLEKEFGEKDLLPLWVADMDFEVPGCVKDALSKYIEKGAYGYPVIPDSYYQAFMDWEDRYHGFRPERQWLRYAPGVVAGFNWGVRLFTEPGDSVIVNTPVYYPFLSAVKDNGRKLVESELINEGGKYSIDFGDFEKKITDNNVKLFILCSPHNPVGRVWKMEELTRLFDICKKHGVFVISDEIHQDITFAGHENFPALSIGRENGRGPYDDMMISFTAASKTFNLAACKNSFVIIPDDKIRKKWDVFTHTLKVNGGNTFGYIAVEAAYRGGREWFDKIRDIIYGNYEYVRDTFAHELPQAVVTPLEGTYLMWIDLGAYLKGSEIEDFIVKKCGLAFDFGSWFGGTKSKSFIRMNLATSRENVAEATNRIIKNIHASSK